MDTLLIVDDMKINREMLRVIFEEQYVIKEAADGEEAIEILSGDVDDIKLIFLDLQMPKKTGLDVLLFMREKYLIDRIPVIMLTGEATNETDLKAYEYGVADIIYKPFEPTVVMRRTQNLIELYHRRLDIEDQLHERTMQLMANNRKMERNNEFLINALGSVVEFRSAESGEHVKRVSEFTRVLLTHLNQLYPEYKLNEEMINMISHAAALHDVGKIAIRDSILNKPGRLTPREFEEMKKHTIYGCEILDRFKQVDSEFYRYCYEICRWHHEKNDGNGYPDGLKGDEIPIWAHAVAMADCFDALVSSRVYKDAYAADVAFDMIKKGECGQFSDQMLAAFVASKFELFAMVEEKER